MKYILLQIKTDTTAVSALSSGVPSPNNFWFWLSTLNNIETVINAVCSYKDTDINMKDQIISYFSKYVNCTSNKIITDILRFSSTWDQYALGISYLNLFLRENEGVKNIKTSNNFVVMFLELLQETVHMIPLKRPTVTKTLAKYQQLIDNCDINDLHLLTKCI